MLQYLFFMLFAICHAAVCAVASVPAKIDFNRDVRPILSNHCWSCHGPDQDAREAGLRLDLRDAALAKTESGVRPIVPGDVTLSALVARIEAHDDQQMPPESFQKRLSAVQREILKRWIVEGAPYAIHWAFVVPQRPPRPVAGQTGWARNEIDEFVLRQLEGTGLTPADEASRETWLRRVTLDLTGLPPTPADRQAFLSNSSPNAYEDVVDHLLESPRHAERLAMHWLDAARYADTNGYNNDELRTLWPWRDWVINAFARNLPYDQFLIEQLAGDLLPDATIGQKVATGFNRNHVLTTEGGIIEEEYRVEYVADRVHTTATVFMGLSLQCARCHDHKYDPFSQREYYQFAAFFNNIPDKVVGYSKGKMAEPLLKLPSPAQQEEQDRLESRRDELSALLETRSVQIGAELLKWEASLTPEQIKAISAASGDASAADATDAEAAESTDRIREILSTVGANRSADQIECLEAWYLEHIDAISKEWQTERAEILELLKKLDDSIPVTMVMAEMSPRRSTHILRRGEYDQPGEEVQAGVPAALSGPSHTSANRLAMARWLTDPQHPLTARVAVNRWWTLLFGAGLVETLEDFGVQGTPPSHPELLDWLATELIRRNWNTREMLKLMVLSATYRQTSDVTPQKLERDPGNRLLARGSRYRLAAETVRDNALAISGLLIDRIGGPSVKPYQPAGLWEDVSVERREKYTPDIGDGLYRRSMYTFWKRTCPPPAMTAFDAPDRETCVIRRARTNTPLQALVLLNDPTYVEAARKFAERVLLQPGSDEEHFQSAFEMALCRSPKLNEIAVLKSVLRAAKKHFSNDSAAAEKLLTTGHSPSTDRIAVTDLAAWTTVTSLILNLDETISKI
ncbi:MAG: PSD1 and planctomycete cytochrome C domain-containing protein [Fuerstiella sp.]|nr:PSD1 and planctomycete cytochrome C domain-containing protein [Fuerstiella sp.]